jgi:toxin ParE1/3/4
VQQYVEAVRSISERPHSFPVVYRSDIRRVIMNHFPYGVFFRPRAEGYEIFAVVDLRRDARHWRRRA